MKNSIKVFLQKLLGFDTYLFLFSIYIINTLKWNKKERDFVFFRNMISDNGIILDIGANIGAMAVHLARTHKNASIYAFEPIPNNFITIKRIIRRYKINNITLIESALGDETGTIEMVMPMQKSAKLQGLSHVLHQSITENNEGEKFLTPITTLDNFFIEKNIEKPITAIKMDVENFEYFVLNGSKEILKKYKPVIYCELWENKNREDCFSLLKELGYETRVLHRKKLCTFDSSIDKTQNFFFIPK